MSGDQSFFFFFLHYSENTRNDEIQTLVINNHTVMIKRSLRAICKRCEKDLKLSEG